MATYAKKSAHGGGINASPHATMGKAKKVGKGGFGNTGKVASQAAPPLPKQKLKRGSGIAGRNSTG